MSRHFRALAALAGALLAAPPAVAQPAAEPTDREIARAFYAGFVEAREIDARCDLLEPERRAKFAADLEYLRADTVREFDAALVAEAEDVGKRYARVPEYLDCGQAAMDRVENRFERLDFVVGIDRWKREAPEGREFAEEAARIGAEVEAELAAEEAAGEPVAPGPTEAERKEMNLAMLAAHRQVTRIETRCRFLDEAMRTRVLALHERMARGLREKIADPAAVAAVESAPDTTTDCGDKQRQGIEHIAGQIDQTEALVEAMEQLDAMMSGMKRQQEAAAAVDLDAPLPPPPVDRPKPLTKAQKQKARNLQSYARALRLQRIESQCRFLPEATRVRVLRAEARYAGLLRREIGDDAAVAEADAAPAAEPTCDEAERDDIAHAANVVGVTEDMIEMMESTTAAEAR